MSTSPNNNPPPPTSEELDLIFEEFEAREQKRIREEEDACWAALYAAQEASDDCENVCPHCGQDPRWCDEETERPYDPALDQ